MLLLLKDKIETPFIENFNDASQFPANQNEGSFPIEKTISYIPLDTQIFDDPIKLKDKESSQMRRSSNKERNQFLITNSPNTNERDIDSSSPKSSNASRNLQQDNIKISISLEKAYLAVHELERKASILLENHHSNTEIIEKWTQHAIQAFTTLQKATEPLEVPHNADESIINNFKRKFELEKTYFSELLKVFQIKTLLIFHKLEEELENTQKKSKNEIQECKNKLTKVEEELKSEKLKVDKLKYMMTRHHHYTNQFFKPSEKLKKRQSHRLQTVFNGKNANDKKTYNEGNNRFYKFFSDDPTHSSHLRRFTIGEVISPYMFPSISPLYEGLFGNSRSKSARSSLKFLLCEDLKGPPHSLSDHSNDLTSQDISPTNSLPSPHSDNSEINNEASTSFFSKHKSTPYHSTNKLSISLPNYNDDTYKIPAKLEAQFDQLFNSNIPISAKQSLYTATENLNKNITTLEEIKQPQKQESNYSIKTLKKPPHSSLPRPLLKLTPLLLNSHSNRQSLPRLLRNSRQKSRNYLKDIKLHLIAQPVPNLIKSSPQKLLENQNQEKNDKDKEWREQFSSELKVLEVQYEAVVVK